MNALVDMTPKGHGYKVVHGAQGARQATCACGWAGTPMTKGPGAEQAVVDQYRSHLRSA